MELEGYGEAPLSTDDIINHALNEHASSQASLLEAIANLSQAPSNRSGASFNAASIAAQDTLRTTVGVIVSCEELSRRERSEYIASLCLGTESERISFLREIIPGGDFPDTETPHEVLVEMFEDWLDRGMGAVDVAKGVEENYKQNFMLDIDEVLDSIEMPKKARFLHALKEAGKQAADTGKITAAVIVGTVLAQKLIKKLDG